MPLDPQARAWRKSRYSNVDGDCVEGCALDRRALVRDSKHRSRGYLTVTDASWSSLVRVLKI
ncbi:DUF397 domain-containing protein [Embleya sp. AB8]|uniref:DUF397 domain-containing protein n=1 Tax=Embleya sp. AB8 TaxID=3156304 RepID=UPI003C77243B